MFFPLCELVREHELTKRGSRRTNDADRPKQTPPKIEYLVEKLARHGFASLAFAAGVPLKIVSEVLGHSGIAITSQTYVHLLDDMKREKSDRLDSYLDRVFTKAEGANSDGS